MNVTRTERGWAGHLIVSNRCRYHRNTLLESGRRRVVVSTVGNYFPRDADEPETVGAGRYYETMAFKAHKDRAYWDADVTKQIYFDSEWAIGDLTDDVDNRADEMHEAVVAEIFEKLVSGRKL